MCGLKISNTSAHMQSYYGHGKLLLTGEYFVLDGARALAVPTRFGQHLRVQTLHSSESILYWVALNNKNKPWLNLVFDTSDFSFTPMAASPDAKGAGERLAAILKAAQQINPAFLADKKDMAVETRLEFANEWGLGTSSTLIYCVAQWAGVDGYGLLQQTLGGSGYDVACAGCDKPILYQLANGRPLVTALNWQPVFSGHIYFAYTGQKQLSREGIQHYRRFTADKTKTIDALNRITDTMINTASLTEFEELVEEHETIIGAALKQVKVGDTIFSDYWGTAKSLGAWGGDYVMLTNNRSESDLREYLSEKNISIVFSWKDLILSNNTGR
jgi:mevalonate kinase